MSIDMGLNVEKCLQAWTNSLKQLSVKADVVFYGDSLTYYGDFSTIFPMKVVCNLGLRGDTIQGLIDRIEQVKLVHPSIIYLMAGINDVANVSVAEFKIQYERLLECLQAELPGVHIIIQNLLPVNNTDFTISCSNDQIRSCNIAIAELAEKRNLKTLDLYSLYQRDSVLPSNVTRDGIHLKDEQYDVWYRLIEETKLENE